MKIISFELTMPNKGSWDNKWSGEGKKYFIITKLSNLSLKKDHFVRLLQNGSDNWYYRWEDGWGANVHAELINSIEAKKRRKISAGFCGYNWMVTSIIQRGKILASHELTEA